MAHGIIVVIAMTSIWVSNAIAMLGKRTIKTTVLRSTDLPLITQLVGGNKLDIESHLLFEETLGLNIFIIFLSFYALCYDLVPRNR